MQGSFKASKDTSVGEDRYILSEEMQANTSFVVQDVTKSVASTHDGRKFDLIISNYAICLHLDKAELIETMQRIVREALAPGGFLVIGLHDHLPVNAEKLGLKLVQCKSWGDAEKPVEVSVYRKQFSSEPPPLPAHLCSESALDWASLREYLEVQHPSILLGV